jgi:hypothetical protein
MIRSFDVDIDLPSSVDKESFGYTRAMIYDKDRMRISPHPSGYYLEQVPIDPITSLASFDYEDGDFMKVDLLTNRVYDQFSSKEDLLETMEAVNWESLKDRNMVEKLPHIGNYYDMVVDLSPKSIEDLADILALIRPGKIHLYDSYIKDKKKTRKMLYLRPREGMYFKKSHAISYAMMIVCAMSAKSGAIQW